MTNHEDVELIERLSDYGLTLDENVIVCDRRVVDEAIARITTLSTSLSKKAEYDDLVERLRQIRPGGWMSRCRNEAASRLEALEAENARLRETLRNARSYIDGLTPDWHYSKIDQLKEIDAALGGSND